MLPDIPLKSETCAYCQAKGCTCTCSKCNGNSVSPDEILMRVSYCNNECRRLHQTDHALDCKRRKAFARICTFFSDIWDLYQSSTYHLHPVTLTSEQEDGHISVRLHDSVEDPRAWLGESYAVNFPEDMNFPDGTSREAKKAVLFDHQSTDV